MILEAIIKSIFVLAFVLLAVPYMLFYERKVAAWIQDRIGPNRAGPRGLLQPFADGIKLLFKEDFTPAHVDKFLFTLGPCISMTLAFIGLAIIPFADQITVADKTITFQIASINIGVLYLLAVSSLGVYGVLLGGWASNNKYSFFGGVRIAAQMLSYEVPLGLSILSIVLVCGSLRLENIVAAQIASTWNVFTQPVTYFIFLTCIFAENARLPFDLAECEQELVGGYHTEYSALRFGMFFLAEYAHMLVLSSLAVVLFFGGWHFPGLAPHADSLGGVLLHMLIFFLKVAVFVFLYMWVRWTLPRFRFDKLMRLAWQAGVPLSLALLFLNALAVYLFDPRSAAAHWAQLGANIAVALVVLLVMALSKTKIAADNLPLSPDAMDDLT